MIGDDDMQLAIARQMSSYMDKVNEAILRNSDCFCTNCELIRCQTPTVFLNHMKEDFLRNEDYRGAHNVQKELDRRKYTDGGGFLDREILAR